MAILYKLYQDKRDKSLTKGKYFARAIHPVTVTLDTMADIIQRNCSMKRSDVLAVLTELLEVMRDELKNSHRVSLGDIGSFTIGLSSSAADTPKDFSVQKNIKGYHVNFVPKGHVVQSGITSDGKVKRTIIRSLLENVSCQETAKNDVDAKEPTVQP